MPAVKRIIVLQSLNSAGGVASARAGMVATVEVIDGKEKWVVASGRGISPKVGDRIIPIATPAIEDKKPRIITAASEAEGNHQLTCDIPAGEQ